MKVGITSFFVLASPFLAIRLSDGFSVGLLDLMAPILLLIVMPRISLLTKNLLGIFFMVLAFSLSISFLVVSVISGISVKDLAFARMIFILLPAALLITQPMGEEKLIKLAKLFFWGGGIAIILGILLYHLGIQIRSDQQALWTGDGAGPQLRAGGVLGNSSDFGHLTAVWGSVCGLTIISFSRDKRRFLVSGLIFAVAFYATWIASSRAATLHLLLAYGIALPFLFSRGVWSFIGLTAVLCALIAPFLLSEFSLILPQDVAYRLQRLDFLNLSGNSVFLQTGRFLNWIILLEIYQENWFTGVGYKNINELYGIWGDNSYLTIFVEFGLFAGIVNVALWLWLIFVSLIAAFKTKHGIVFFALVISEALHGFTVDTGTIWYSMPMAWLFISAYYLLYLQQQRSVLLQPQF